MFNQNILSGKKKQPIIKGLQGRMCDKINVDFKV